MKKSTFTLIAGNTEIEIPEDQITEVMNEVQDGYAREVEAVAAELGIPSYPWAGSIWYFRTRSRFAQEIENRVVELLRAGKNVPDFLDRYMSCGDCEEEVYDYMGWV